MRTLSIALGLAIVALALGSPVQSDNRQGHSPSHSKSHSKSHSHSQSHSHTTLSPSTQPPSPTTQPPSTSPPACPSSGQSNILVCGDGLTCNVATSPSGWSCCISGRAACPLEKPIMCNSQTCGANNDYCCDTTEGNCADYGGVLCGSDCPVAACPGTGSPNILKCGDGLTCNVATSPLGWSCCSSGRAGCPLEKPFMCNSQTCGVNSNDYCCDTVAGRCSSFGGVLENCPIAGCPGTGITNILKCGDGLTCNVATSPLGWSCCSTGRAGCPLQKPFLCNSQTCGSGSDNCCDTVADRCADYGGILYNCPS